MLQALKYIWLNMSHTKKSSKVIKKIAKSSPGKRPCLASLRAGKARAKAGSLGLHAGLLCWLGRPRPGSRPAASGCLPASCASQAGLGRGQGWPVCAEDSTPALGPASKPARPASLRRQENPSNGHFSPSFKRGCLLPFEGDS